MKIAVLGTGVVAQCMAEKLLQLGHTVMMGTRNVQTAALRREPDNFGRPGFGDWLKEHAEVKLSTFKEAAAFGELIIHATNGAGALQAIELAGSENLANKVMLDITNPLDFSKGMPPSLLVCNTDSLGEQIQRAIPDTRVVKALNTMTAYLMVNPSLLPEDHNVFICGNDTGAKQEVKQLLTSFGWKDQAFIDIGDITSARGSEQLVAMWVRLWGALQNPIFNFKIVMGPTPAA